MRITPRFARVSATSAVLAGVLLTQQACAGQTSSASTSPSPETSPAAASRTSTAAGAKTSNAAKTGGVFGGDREVWLLPVATEGTLAVSKSKRVELSDNLDDRALFVLTKVKGDQYWIQTAQLRTGGEASCLQANKDKTVTAAADPWLDSLTTAGMLEPLPPPGLKRTAGDAIRRCTYHYWFHIGEILAIRQMLGHQRLPEFVGAIERRAPYHPDPR